MVRIHRPDVGAPIDGDEDRGRGRVERAPPVLEERDEGARACA